LNAIYDIKSNEVLAAVQNEWTVSFLNRFAVEHNESDGIVRTETFKERILYLVKIFNLIIVSYQPLIKVFLGLFNGGNCTGENSSAYFTLRNEPPLKIMRVSFLDNGTVLLFDCFTKRHYLKTLDEHEVRRTYCRR
jgi:hypothetical protein